MADYSDSKYTVGAVSPENAIASAWDRLEPLLTPEQRRMRFLFVIPLVSKMIDPETGRRMKMGDELLQDYIVRAVSVAEDESHADIMPVKRREKKPFDRPTYDSFGYIELNHKPVSSIDKFSVTPADNNDIYELPKNWIETANMIRGQVNIIPLNIALTGGGIVPTQSAGGSLYLSIMNMRGWVPAFWQVEYTSGFPDGLVPREVNELIGTIAAMDILSMLGATDADVTSRSLGIDGMSQSIGGPGADKFRPRIEELAKKRQQLVRKLKTKLGMKLFSSWV